MAEKAQVGDLIRVIDIEEAYGAYDYGEVLEVERVDDCGDVYVKGRYFDVGEPIVGGDQAFLTDGEYVIHRKAGEEDETEEPLFDGLFDARHPSLSSEEVDKIIRKEETQADRIKRAGTELTDLLVRKNHDYGDSFAKQYEKYGLMSALIRMDDKMRRLETLLGGTDAQVDESIKDSLLDLAGYALLASIEAGKR